MELLAHHPRYDQAQDPSACTVEEDGTFREKMGLKQWRQKDEACQMQRWMQLEVNAMIVPDSACLKRNSTEQKVNEAELEHTPTEATVTSETWMQFNSILREAYPATEPEETTASVASSRHLTKSNSQSRRLDQCRCV
eukprot:gnl/MRDRNA2_/MRDRNA2_164748_c0_seq1.p1 gnl/MRDRNA2_/MRDRNA2_164748_c0~~gnl/MRDRNA2_/MRDRNA2_164748_c0_seq1.p1  ORF type:complete len:138 (+),score=28.44 gnl/MRDRNA2_/MRDRNA2_164748_c0_seq1:297-710(+)